MICDPQAEHELIFTAVFHPGAYTEAAGAGLEPEHFTLWGAQAVWAYFALIAETESREPNGGELREHFKNSPTEMELLNSLWAMRDDEDRLLLPISIVAWSAARLVNLAQQRQLAGLCSEAVETLKSSGDDALDLATSCLGRFKPIAAKLRIADHEESFGGSCAPEQLGLWGIGTLDLQVPLDAGRLVYVAARTSVGKTALGLTAARATARSGRPVLFVSAEMTHRELSHRLFAMEAVSPTPSTGHDAEAWQRTKALDATLTMIVARRMVEVRNTAIGRGLALLVIDYVQRFEPSRETSRRHEAVEAVSGELQEIAKRWEIPVLALAQLSRKADERKTEPYLSDLRDSGALEQDADAVVGMWIDERDGLMAVVMKNRHGPTAARVKLSMDHFLISERFGSEWSEA